jgi:SNF2 family DNA or RNA helicase
MLRKDQMHGYQNHCVQHILDNPYCALLLAVGLGKSVSTLTALDIIKYDRFEPGKILVIAPKRVAEHTWSAEVKNWEHLRHLTVSVCVGSEKQRKAALKVEADIYTINRERISWLVAYLKGAWPFKIVVIDELSSFKSGDSSRFTSLKVVRPLINRVIGLTATPAPNSLEDLWPQVYLMDRGERLGKTLTQYRERYFVKKENGFGYRLRQSDDAVLGHDIYEREIYDRISDICISMKAQDYLTMPERIDTDEIVTMPEALFSRYKTFERQAVIQMSDQRITAVNAGVLAGKLLQFSNGAIYDEDKTFHEVHDLKIEALGDAVESLNGNPVLCFYNFQSDVARIQKKLKHFKPHLIGGPGDIDKWNNGEIPFLLAHPASAGHGLNMQYGGSDIFWFGLPWSLELWQQANGRIHRQGKVGAVRVKRFLTAGTMEDRVVKSLATKEDSQDLLLEAVKAFVQGYS